MGPMHFPTAQTNLFLGQLFCILGCPNEQFGIHEKLSVGYTGFWGMTEYLAFANYSGWGMSIQIGADFNYIKQCKFTSTLSGVHMQVSIISN